MKQSNAFFTLFLVLNIVFCNAQSEMYPNNLKDSHVFIVLPTIQKKITALENELLQSKKEKTSKRLQKMLAASKTENQALQKDIIQAANKAFLIKDFHFIYDTCVQQLNKNIEKIAFFDKQMKQTQLNLDEKQSVFLVQYRKLNFENTTGLDGFSCSQWTEKGILPQTEAGIRPLTSFLYSNGKAMEKAMGLLNKKLKRLFFK